MSQHTSGTRYCHPHNGYHHPFYCTCPSTCDVCGIACTHTTATHDEAMQARIDDAYDTQAKEDHV